MILFTDADMSTPIEELEPMLAEMAKSPIVIASRAAEGSMEQNRSGLRQLLSNVLRTLARVILGLKFADTQCGFKLFRADVAKELFAAQLIDGFLLRPRASVAGPEQRLRGLRSRRDLVRRPRIQGGATAHQLRVLGFTGRNPPAPQAPSRRPSPDLRVRIALVSALPPSRTTLNEYGHHLAKHLSENESVQSLTVWSETSLPAETAAANPSVICEPVWEFNSVLNPFGC